ncbi:MAG: hypothetical protein KDB65_02865 [Calditrichaeota bacterium]|nr:hypothetical protein [Calditrichota bacterium]MCB9367935.1 hypothetical protein [Calditrichota bacterium]
MKLIRWAALIVAAISILLSGVGCQQKTSTDTGGGGGDVVGSVQILTGVRNDTLAFLPNDSASTNVTVIVTDTRGLAMPNQKVNIALLDNDLGSIEFVDTDLKDTTNALGRVNCVFRVYNEAGNQVISATAGGVTAQVSIAVRQADEEINSVTMIVTPEEVEASELADDSARIDLRIVDSGNRGVPNVSLNLTATGGLLVYPPVTDSTGRTTTWWYNNRQFGNFTIYVRAGSLRDSATISVTEVPRVLGTLELTTSDREIEADGCITAATITATLKNVFGEAVGNDTIRFGAPDHGSVESFAITNELGVATVDFCGMNIPNEQDPEDSSKVVARYEKWGLRDTVNVRIIPASGIGLVNLTSATTSGVAGRDSIALNLEVRFANGTPVTGYYAKFNATQCGDFKYDSTRLVNGHPDTTNYYYLCNSIPQSPPEITVEVDGVFSDPLVMSIEPGEANLVTIRPIAPITIGGSAAVTAVVQDTFHNPVREGEVVIFTTTLGSIAPFVNTNTSGQAITQISSGTQAGVGVVTAKLLSGLDSSSTTFVVNPGDGSTISMTLNPSSMLVSGSGGQDWSQIEARVFDANGNPVEDGLWVTFTLSQDAPEGANINNSGLVDSAQTSNGVAVATLNAGTGVGPVLVNACITRESGIEQCSPASGSIVAGPPAEIQIGVNEIGTHAGGAAWDVEISALIKDAARNNVINGTAVFFTVVEGEIAQILSEEVVVGNTNADGETHAGVAYTTLRYTSLVTNEDVTIIAQTANGTSRQFIFRLPVQEPAIVLNCMPGSWHFVADGDPCEIELQAIVRDGHQVLINGQSVYYTAQRGRIYSNSNGTPPTRSTAITGPEFSGFPDGTCSLWLVESASFIFPDPQTPEIPGEVRVEVIGYPDATDSQVINFRRGVG